MTKKNKMKWRYSKSQTANGAIGCSRQI